MLFGLNLNRKFSNATFLTYPAFLPCIFFRAKKSVICSMMSLYEFQQLPHNEQAELTWKGTFLGDRTEADQVIQLFSLDLFYVEVVYQKHSNEIIAFKAFKDVRLLAPYLPKIL